MNRFTHNGQTIYYGTGGGCTVSVSGGVTFTNLSTFTPPHIGRIRRAVRAFGRWLAEV